MIDITMTASLRPEIIEQTLQSIRTNFINPYGFRLIVDIAPVGDTKYTQQDVLNTILKYFPYPIVRAYDESLQAEAIMWAWEQTRSEFVIHWEDDWTLERRLDINALIHFMQRNEFCGQLSFDRKEKSCLDYPPYKDVFIKHSFGFWKRIKGVSLGGPPTMLRKTYIDEVRKIMKPEVCLDILSQTEEAKSVMRHWETYVYTGARGKLVKDIGRPWLQQMKMKKVKRTDRGVTWISL